MPYPTAPIGHPTIRVFLAGGVPEVMLHLRELGLLQPRRAHGATGETAGQSTWNGGQSSERRKRLRDHAGSNVDRHRPGHRHHESPTLARKARGLTSSLVTFPTREPLPRKGAVIKSTAIDPFDGRCRRRLPQDWPGESLHHREGGHRGAEGPRRTGTSSPGDVLVLCCRGPLGPPAWRRLTR